MTLSYNGANTNDAPATDYFTVTPSDTTNFTTAARALYVGSGGTIAAVNQAGTVVNFEGVPTGAVLPVVTIRVNSTNTTAASIVGLL